MANAFNAERTSLAYSFVHAVNQGASRTLVDTLAISLLEKLPGLEPADGMTPVVIAYGGKHYPEVAAEVNKIVKDLGTLSIDYNFQIP